MDYQNLAFSGTFSTVDREIEELKELVRRNIEISKETRDQVMQMHRANRRSTILRWTWRLLIIGAFAFGYYVYVLPYLTQILAMYESVRGGASEAQGFGAQIVDFFKNLGQ